MRKLLPVKKAILCAQIVKDLYATHAEQSQTQPLVYEPGFHDRHWVIAWEGAPEGWVVTATDEIVKRAGVFAEPLNGWSVAVMGEERNDV